MVPESVISLWLRLIIFFEVNVKCKNICFFVETRSDFNLLHSAIIYIYIYIYMYIHMYIYMWIYFLRWSPEILFNQVDVRLHCVIIGVIFSVVLQIYNMYFFDTTWSFQSLRTNVWLTSLTYVVIFIRYFLKRHMYGEMKRMIRCPSFIIRRKYR